MLLWKSRLFLKLAKKNYAYPQCDYGFVLRCTCTLDTQNWLPLSLILAESVPKRLLITDAHMITGSPYVK